MVRCAIYTPVWSDRYERELMDCGQLRTIMRTTIPMTSSIRTMELGGGRIGIGGMLRMRRSMMWIRAVGAMRGPIRGISGIRGRFGRGVVWTVMRILVIEG